MAVLRVGFFLASENVPRLAAWYKALGVPLNDDGYGFVGGEGPVEGSIVSVMPSAPGLAALPEDVLAEEPYGRRRVTLNLLVDDLAATIEGLRARGGEVAGPKDLGYGLFAWVKDPDGNLIELWQMPPT